MEPRRDPMRLRVLGPPDLRMPGGERAEELLGRPKRLALLIYIAVARPRGLHRRDTLLALLWPEFDEKRARNALSQSLHVLREALAPGAVLGHGRQEVGLDAAVLACDAVLLDEHLERGEPVEALQLYRGDLASGFHVDGVPGFERWLDGERRRLRRRAADAARELAGKERERGNAYGEVRWLRRALEIEPVHEETTAALVQGLAAAGDVAGALETFERFAGALRERYELEPSGELLRLASEVRAGRTGPHGAHRVAGPAAGGEHGPVRSVAVLPLADLNADPGAAPFVDGMTEALIASLARIRPLRVISRQSVLRFEGSDRPLDEIGRTLEVDAVVEGSVLRVGDRVRITVQLVRVRPEGHLWSEVFTGDLRDVLELQDRIGGAIAEAVRELTGGPEFHAMRPARIRTVEPAAYDAFLRGIFAWGSGRPDARVAAIEEMRRAMELDPDFPPPYAFFVYHYGMFVVYGIVPPGKARPELMRAARRAIELDVEYAGGHFALGETLHLCDRDWADALAAYEEGDRLAFEGGYSSLEISAGYGSYLMFLAAMGRIGEALTKVHRLLDVDPIGWPPNALLGWLLYKARRFDEAVRQLQKTAELRPGVPETLIFLALSHLFLGREREAVAVAEGALRAAPPGDMVLGLAAALFGRAGQPAKGRELVARLEATGEERYLDPVHAATAWAGLGEREAALARLERIVEGESGLAWALPVILFFDPLRDDPRYVAVVEGLGLPASHDGGR